MNLLIKILELCLNRGFTAPKWEPPQTPSFIALLCHGRIGDIMMCSPAIRAIKETFPHCKVVAVVHYKKEAILKNNPNIDRILSAKRGIFGYYKLYSALRNEKLQGVLLFHGNDPLIYALFHLACPGILVGFDTTNPLKFY